MLQQSQYYISETITSFTTQKVYAEKGDIVTLLSTLENHLSVVCVKDKNGHTFPVNVKYLTKKKVEAEVKAPEPNPEPVKTKEKKKVAQPKLL